METAPRGACLTAASLDARQVDHRSPANDGHAMIAAMFLQLLANGLVTGAVFAIAAAGVSIVYGILRLVHFAYGDVVAFGAFVAFWLNVTHGPGIVEATALAMVA